MMKQSRFDYGPTAGASWLGLAYVYSGIFWLWAFWVAAREGNGGGAALFAFRLVGTLGLGVGLCAAERWAWAAMTVHLALHGVAAGLLALTSAGALATRPANVLSWQPVFLGLTSAETTQVLGASAFLALVAATGISVLWKAQAHFDIPHRRPFTFLTRLGIVPALFLAGLDAVLLFGWWKDSAGMR